MGEGQAIHASCVSIDGRALLLMGSSGSGKSDLALRLIDRGASLVSDDQTLLKRHNDQLLAAPPATIQGKIEVRGIGIISMTCLENVPVALAVALEGNVERFPLAEEQIMLAGIEMPLLRLAPFEASAPIKVELAMKRLRS